MPVCPSRSVGEKKRHLVGSSVEHQAEGRVIPLGDDAAEPLFFRIPPVGLPSAPATPYDVRLRIEPLLTQNRMVSTKGPDAAGEAKNVLLSSPFSPVVPAGFVVLTVGVVVATLPPPTFVPAEKHRYPTRDEKGQEKVLDLNRPQAFDPKIAVIAFAGVG